MNAHDWLLRCPAEHPSCSSGGTTHKSSEPPHDLEWPVECVLYLQREREKNKDKEKINEEKNLKKKEKGQS